MRIAFFGTYFSVCENMTGIGYRIWEIGNVLAESNQTCIYQKDMPEKFFMNKKNKNLGFKKRKDIENIQQEVAKYDVLIFESIFQDQKDVCLLYEAYRQNKIIITDSLINPIEHLFFDNIYASDRKKQIVEKMISLYKIQLFLSDYIIVGSEKEFDIMLGTLSGLGRINQSNFFEDEKLEKLIGVVPIGYSKKYNEVALTDTADKIKKRSEVKNSRIRLIWNGGLWNFYKPKVLIRAVNLFNNKYELKITLEFMYYKNTKHTQAAKETKKYSDRLCRNEYIKFNNENVHFTNRESYIQNANFIIVCVEDSVETKTSLRLRTRDVFLYRKPMIVNKF